MKKIIQIIVCCLLLFCSSNFVFGQDKAVNDPDSPLKESLYKKYKREVQAYDKKHFDELFFDFFKKQNDVKLLTKEEFYSYTIKIAIYSEKLGLLYRTKKEESQKTKQEWFDKSYLDYLTTKK